MRKGNNFDEPAKVIKREDAPEQTLYALTFSEAVTNFFKSRFSKERFKKFIEESFPHKTDSTKEKIRKTVMDVSFVLLVLGLAYMVFYYCSYRERINDLGNWEIAIDSINEDELFEFEVKKLWENIKEQYPDIDFPEGMSLKFASLYAVNQDVVGVIRIPEMDFFSILLQNKSSPSYYLWKDMYGQYSRYGNPYVDYRCNVEGELSKNTIIYGHNTHDKLGFNKLTDYMTLAGYKAAPVITIETLYEKTQWKIFAVMLTNSTSAADRGHLFSYLITDFSSTAEFTNMLSGIEERSMINTPVDVNANDKIMTLYTCYQDIFDGGRLVVFARLVRDGESAEVDVSKASFNHNARYPQAYYDQLGLTNPYEKLTEPIIYETDENGSLVEVTTDTVFTDETTAEEPVTNEMTSAQAGSSEETTAAVGTEATSAENTVAETTAVSAVPEETTAALQETTLAVTEPSESVSEQPSEQEAVEQSAEASETPETVAPAA